MKAATIEVHKTAGYWRVSKDRALVATFRTKREADKHARTVRAALRGKA